MLGNILRLAASIKLNEAQLNAIKQELTFTNLNKIVQIYNHLHKDEGKYKIEIIYTGLNLPTPDEKSSEVVIVKLTLLDDKPRSISILGFNELPLNPTMSMKFSIRLSANIWSVKFSTLLLLEPDHLRSKITGFAKADEKTINTIKNIVLDKKITGLFATMQIDDPESGKVIARSLDASSIPGDFRDIVRINQ